MYKQMSIEMQINDNKEKYVILNNPLDKLC